MLRRLNRARVSILPTPPWSTVRLTASANPRTSSAVMVGGIASVLGSVTRSSSAGPRHADHLAVPGALGGQPLRVGLLEKAGAPDPFRDRDRREFAGVIDDGQGLFKLPMPSEPSVLSAPPLLWSLDAAICSSISRT